MNEAIPEMFWERLRTVIPQEDHAVASQRFFSTGNTGVRINTLKTGRRELLQKLKERNASFREAPWAEEALVLDKVEAVADLEEQGVLYRQGLSSQLAVVVLDPRPGERVLDMCAAPGSKATQIAARMDNRGEIVCLEKVRARYYKLKSVAQLMGAKNMSFYLMDARRYRMFGGLFDRILVDAPCSSEGRFRADKPETFAYWSLRKIKEMARKQKGLLLAASRLLSPGGRLVYSTCTFAPEENEQVVDWFLRKAGGAMTVEPVRIEGLGTYPAVTQWQGRVFDPQITRCLRILPSPDTEGFFLASLKKNH